ncbi:MAG: phosphoethanolamine--lipid A transferase [Sulfurovaceae bacterium]|nr:phosphoethanolamine--lipid A transferase [Sulfurovaceae bacterium]
MKPISTTRLIIIISLFLVLFANFTFFSKVTETYTFSGFNILFIISLGVVLFSLLVLLVTLLSSKHTTKPFLITIVIIAAFSAYFMYSYQVVIDTGMMQNAVQTNINESLDLFSWQLVAFVLFLGILPSIYIYKQPLIRTSFKQALKIKVLISTLFLSVIVMTILVFGSYYSSFFREHKPLRFYTNPIFPIYSFGKYTSSTLFPKHTTFTKLGTDVKIKPNNERKLVIMVVGEAARADHFSLNGYSKDTNPELKKESNLIDFTHVTSCGTSTAVSVPCMFSFLGDDGIDTEKARSQENVLDVLKRAGVNVLWRDNNSDSKGVATRVEYENYRTPSINTVCEGDECRDEGMLKGLQTYIDDHKSKDILIVLHQMGNHGPAYYKRYPKIYEKFTPTCKTNQLEECSEKELCNGYDNAILYTDDFLNKVIELLKQNDNKFETAMLYASDHGESLGENGVYLHGLPKLVAPDAQTHIGMMIWLGSKTQQKFSLDRLKQEENNSYSHANLPHTLLGFFDAKTNIYNKKLDIINSN